MTTALSVSEIRQCIYYVRGCQVIFDDDVAKFYEVSPKRINEQVRRNATRFPADFMFQLEQLEYDSLRSKVATLNTGRGKHRKYMPLVFTEQGVAMLSGVLKSERAVAVNIAIMRAFVQLRNTSAHYEELKQELSDLKQDIRELHQKWDVQSKTILDVVQRPDFSRSFQL